MEKSNSLIAKIISVIFHPLLMPSYALVIIFNSNTHYSYMPYEAQKLIYILVFLCTFLIPVSTIPFLMNLKVISGVSMKTHRERIIPLLISALAYYFAYYLLGKLPLSTIGFIKMMILASSMLILVSLIVSFKWKISAHLVGIGGLLASMFFYAVYFVANFTLLIMVLSLIAGAIAYSRLKMQAHTPAQVYVGFLTGFAGMLFILYLGLSTF